MRIIDTGENKILFDDDKMIRVVIAKDLLFDQNRTENEISITQFYKEHFNIVKQNLSETKNTEGYFTSSINTKDFQYRGVYNKYINLNLRVVCEAIEYYEDTNNIKFDDEQFNKWFNILDSEYYSLNQDSNFRDLTKEDKVNRLTQILNQKIL